MHPAQLTEHFINTAIVTAVVAGFILWRYKAGVLAGMNVGSPFELPIPLGGSRTTSAARVPADSVLTWERRVRRRVSITVALVVLVSCLPLAYLQAAAFDGRTPMHVMGQTGQFLIAAVPMAALLAGYSWRRTLIYGAVLMAAAVVLMLVVSALQRLAAGRAPSLDQFMNGLFFLQLTAVNAFAPLVVIAVTALPRLRGVAPMTFVGLLVFSLAPLGGIWLTFALARTSTGGELVLNAGLATGFILLALPTGWLAWRTLAATARAYEAKRLAESDLLVNVWWVMFVFAFVADFVTQNGWSWRPFAFALASCAVFAALYRLGLRWAVPLPRPERRTLLLLRVFGDASRTERLFDRVAARWRWLGPVTMIAAPDVAARTVDPGDFLEFATGRLLARFIKNAGDLERRLQHLDGERDPDGRFRVNELCCQADTWRAAVVGLMDQADAVLMDLREFSSKRAGCAFELQQLGQRMEAGRLVLTVDDTTDRDFLLANLGVAVEPRVVQLPARRASDRDLDRVFDEVTAAAY
jgi:hypothetical protein